MTLSQLIERLEGAEEGSRELDALVFKALGYKVKLLDLPGPRKGTFLAYPADGPQVCEPAKMGITTSIDAAMSLCERVTPDCIGEVTFGRRVKHRAKISAFTQANWTRSRYYAWGSTEALALCIALLRAVQARQGDTQCP